MRVSSSARVDPTPDLFSKDHPGGDGRNIQDSRVRLCYAVASAAPRLFKRCLGAFDTCRLDQPHPSAAVINSSRTIYRSILSSATRLALELALARSSISFILSRTFAVCAASKAASAAIATSSSNSTSSSMVAYSFRSFLETLGFLLAFLVAVCSSSMACPCRSSDRADGAGAAFIGGSFFAVAGLGWSGGFGIGFVGAGRWTAGFAVFVTVGATAGFVLGGGI
mmetsp:Transcript_43356/g.43895  ORF Transcript_43356/g.43895 Transcript_43356/m.43895 type:complete len:224 (+) Transcript_43356:76-747(+)